MKIGISRFEYFLNQLQPIMATAAIQKNPALWLYRNNARTPLFMLEGLAKMYHSFHNAKKFTKIKEHLKLLEDSLGAIDYYDTVAKGLVNNKKVPAPVLNYLQAQSREKIQSLNEILSANGWLLPVNNRITKIQKKLSSADWLKEEVEIKQVNEFYGETIYNIVEFVQKSNYRFAHMENEVHELRRKLRWLSIYPHAMRGAIQIKKNKIISGHLKKYTTKEIVTSPFNIMPVVGSSKFTVVLNQHHFYALSWMIAALGNLKDHGLQVLALKEALQQTSTISDTAAYKGTYQLLGNKQLKIEELLENAGNISKIYFEEQNLEHLVIGTTRL